MFEHFLSVENLKPKLKWFLQAKTQAENFSIELGPCIPLKVPSSLAAPSKEALRVVRPRKIIGARVPFDRALLPQIGDAIHPLRMADCPPAATPESIVCICWIPFKLVGVVGEFCKIMYIGVNKYLAKQDPGRARQNI